MRTRDARTLPWTRLREPKDEMKPRRLLWDRVRSEPENDLCEPVSRTLGCFYVGLTSKAFDATWQPYHDREIDNGFALGEFGYLPSEAYLDVGRDCTLCSCQARWKEEQSPRSILFSCICETSYMPMKIKDSSKGRTTASSQRYSSRPAIEALRTMSMMSELASAASLRLESVSVDPALQILSPQVPSLRLVERRDVRYIVRRTRIVEGKVGTPEGGASCGIAPVSRWCREMESLDVLPGPCDPLGAVVAHQTCGTKL